MSVGPDLPPDPVQRGPIGPSSVAGDLAAIFADAGTAAGPVGSGSKVRTVTGRRSRVPYTTLGAVAAAGLVGLTAGFAFLGGHGKAADAAPVKPAEPVLPVQVATAPTVTLQPSDRGPIPVLETAPVAPATAVRPAGLHRFHAQGRSGPADLMTADRRLRAAYSHAIHAGVPRRVLAAYRDRWADLREDATWRPARVAAGYGEMTADLERLARQSHGRRPPPRRGLFGLFS